MIRIETKQLILINFISTDIDDFYEYMSLESTAKYEDFEPLQYDQCIASIKRRIPQDNVFAVILKDNGKMIGDVNFSAGEDSGTYEIGYDFNEKFWNRGYATEACIAMINHIFNEVSGRRVYALCNDDNISSIKLLQRIGMRREGHFIEDVTFKKDTNGNSIYINTCLYAILKREWKFK
jgi:RimJ/RimL family protein N-acetyltransferase